MSHIIMPVGCPKWMFNRKRPFDVNGVVNINRKASIIGLYDKAKFVNSNEDMEMITVFFMPYAAKMITSIPCQEFYNDNVDFEDLESADFKELKARILEAETTDECIGMIEDFIIRRLIKTQDSPYFNPMAKVFERMIANPNVRIEELASVACLSERQFRRVFIENVGIKHAKWDKEDGYFVPRDCYNSYFYIVEDDSLTILDKFRLHGAPYIQHLTGGSALHLNLDEHLSKEQYRQLLRVAATEGCNYFTFNIPNTICNDCGHIDKRYLKECPVCHSKNVDYMTRIIGYLKRISNFSQGRQEEAQRRYYHDA